MHLCGRVYELTKSFPDEEKYGLTSQMRRCSVSIPSNISEGSGSGSANNFSRYLHIAIGSICELETQLYVAYHLKYITRVEIKELSEQTDKLKRMVLSFKKSINNKNEHV